MKILPLTQLNIQNTQKRKQCVSFEGFKCSEDSFEVKNLYNIPCPICAKPMIHTSEIEEFSKEIGNKKGKKLANFLNQYQTYFHEKEKLLVEKIKLEAISEDGDLETLTKKCIQKHFDEQKEEQLRIISRLKNSASSLETSKKDEIIKFTEKYEDIIENNEDFNKILFLNEIERISSFSNSYHKKTIKNARKIPDGKDATSTLYKRLSIKNSQEIAKELLLPALATTEHIKAQSSGGENNTANYLAQCSECNHERGNKDFKVWVSAFPDFTKTMNQYIEAIALRLRRGELDEKYDTYLSDITETIKEETQGRFILEAPEIKKGNEPEEREVILNFVSKLIKSKNEIYEKLNSTIAIKEQMESDEQYRYIAEYVKSENELEQKDIEEKEKLAQRQECQNKIELYYQTREEIETLTIQLKNPALAPKNRNYLENKLAQLKNQIQKIDTKNLKDKVSLCDIELSQITITKNKLKLKINELKNFIDFPQDIEAELTKIKTHFDTLGAQYTRLNNLYAKITQKNSLLHAIKEKEIRLSNLILSNQQIDTSKSNGEDVKTYRDLVALHRRAIIIEEIFLNNLSKKAKEEDKIIFEYAKSKMMEQIEDLAQNSSAVRYQLNLDEIQEATNEIRQLSIEVEQIRSREAEIEKLEKELEKYGTPAETQNKIKEMTAKLELAQLRFNSIDINTKIDKLIEEIEKIENCIESLKKENLTRKEFATITSVFNI